MYVQKKQLIKPASLCQTEEFIQSSILYQKSPEKHA